MTDYKALCAELLKALSEWALGQGSNVDAPLIIRTRAALAQPEPVGAALFHWRNLGDGKPVQVRECPMCGIAPANVDDCGRFGDPACPYFGVGEPEPEGAADEEIEREALKNADSDDEYRAFKSGAFFVQERISRPAIKPEGLPPRVGHILRLAEIIREVDGNHDKGAAALAEAILAHPAAINTQPAPVPAAERFEFSVFNSEYEEQAGGNAPTYAEALSYGQHYLSQYSQDGPHSLEIRRVEVLPHHALPAPGAEVG